MVRRWLFFLLLEGKGFWKDNSLGNDKFEKFYFDKFNGFFWWIEVMDDIFKYKGDGGLIVVVLGKM